MQAFYDTTLRAGRRIFSGSRRLIWATALLGVLFSGSYAVGSDVDPVDGEDCKSACMSCGEFDRLNTLVRDGKLAKSAARQDIFRALATIRQECAVSGRDAARPEVVAFPVAGYDLTAAGKGRRHGYVPRGYDYYDGNRHGGHPALDIFIHDRNQDGRDDRTGDQVPVVAMSGGVVVARETEWSAGSTLRGGKYVWVYDPSSERLYYYAHLAQVSAAVGAVVKSGDILGTIGRTGVNAYKKRSPTHLHLMILSANRDSLPPVYSYPLLSQARVRR